MSIGQIWQERQRIEISERLAPTRSDYHHAVILCLDL